MKKNALFIAICSVILLGCNSTPKPIAYGSEGCHYCSMTIVDKQHAAQLMTKKGRSYAFDASECMLNHLKDIDVNEVGLFLTNTYYKPGHLTDATKATYLISHNLPSPMGEFLTAFDTPEEAQRAQLANQGELFTWEELLARFKIE